MPRSERGVFLAKALWLGEGSDFDPVRTRIIYSRSDDGRHLVSDYLRSPSLRHLRDPHSIQTVSRSILKEIVRHNPIWGKWTKERETVGRTAAYCWIPVADLRDYLNDLPGPALTQTDVIERLRAFNEEDYEPTPDDDQKTACLEIYQRERQEGTEMPAIVGAIQRFVEEDKEQQRLAHQERYRLAQEEQRKAAEDRLLYGADCKWTPYGSSTKLYCRANGRTYRLEKQPDRKWELCRLSSIDELKGEYIGSYSGRGDATKVVSDMAYKAEPRWR